jgi:chaperone modulatory protein CbpM
MNMETRSYSSDSDFEAGAVEAWVAAGWLLPQEFETNWLSEIDLARAHLIQDLKSTFGVNDEGVPLILDLIDQLHGVRRALREVMAQRA